MAANVLGFTGIIIISGFRCLLCSAYMCDFRRYPFNPTYGSNSREHNSLLQKEVGIRSPPTGELMALFYLARILKSKFTNDIVDVIIRQSKRVRSRTRI